MGYEATMYLLERGVRLTGTDAWSWDAPFVYTAKKYAETKDASLIWEGHKAGRDIGYCHIEKLHNLEQLPPTASSSAAFRTRSAAHRRAGRARSRSSTTQALRHAVFALLRSDAPAATVQDLRKCLVSQAEVEYTVPARIGDYTDFYTSIDHALNITRLFNPEGDVTPNFRWIPTAYHGRVSTIGVSGQRFHRPMGQTMAPGAKAPTYHACARLDYELELGVWIGEGNAAGEPIPLERAEEHIFGICLLNDWSARDIQFWEMAPLGPFLAKNFATTISPWIVTIEALAPYRQAWTRPASEPQPLDYLESTANRDSGAIDISLEVWLESDKARENKSGPSRLSGTSFRHQYWSVAQMVAHHTMGGCKLNSGDLFGSGTISGPGPGEAGAIIELTRAGQSPVALANGEQRGFLEDGDAVLLRGWCEKPGHARIGFGESRGTVLPAKG
jgi:fumarylacetoacetase